MNDPPEPLKFNAPAAVIAWIASVELALTSISSWSDTDDSLTTASTKLRLLSSVAEPIVFVDADTPTATEISGVLEY
jgi:hypothetical protein